MTRIFLTSFIIFAILCNFLTEAQGSLCDVDGIHSEIQKAIYLLKLKQNATTTPPLQNQTSSLRQDDDDDTELPYYVPAIAKVVGAVLSANVTNVIQESFGFIPPEVNVEIQNVLGLVADQIQKYVPTKATTTTPAPIKTVANPAGGIAVSPDQTHDPQSIANIEAWLAIALAQEINKTINANMAANASLAEINSLQSTTVLPSFEISAPAVTKILSIATVQPIPQLISSTSKPGTRKAEVSSGVGILSTFNNGGAIYAPAYAPNYVETTTQIPIYAPAFAHQNYSVTTTINPLIKLIQGLSSTTGKTTQAIETTTEDEEEEYEEGD